MQVHTKCSTSPSSLCYQMGFSHGLTANPSGVRVWAGVILARFSLERLNCFLQLH